MEVVRYVSPAPKEHGHCVQPEGEVPRLTRCYVQKAEMVPNEGTWIALEKETVDELSKRRRIREKSSIPPAIFYILIGRFRIIFDVDNPIRKQN